MKRFIQLTCGGGDKIWIDVDKIAIVNEYKIKSDPDIKSVIGLNTEGCGWHIRETPKEVFEKIREVEK